MNVYDRLLPYVKKPSRYLGYEINAQKKDLSRMEVKIALAFPDTYELGMSYLGFKILYHVLNRSPGVAAERVFMPGSDYMALLQSNGLELSSMESRLPLSRFDLVGFTLQYELSYTNILQMMRLGGIPLRREERGEDDPFVIGGGPCAFNPEPMADFFDALVLGDGEEVILEIVEARRRRREGCNRADFLHDLASIEGVYVPSFFRPEYDGKDRVKGITPLLEGYNSVAKRVVKDIDKAPYPTDIVVPFSDIVHDRVSVEAVRGCTRGCRFCQAGNVYRPVRERHPDTVKRIVRCSLEDTGYEEISLSSLSIGDYGAMSTLIPELMADIQSSCTALSLPSLRPGTLDPTVLEEINRVRKTGFTLAPEAGTPRLRRVINKEMSEDVIMEDLSTILKAGWDFIKLYFMIGLPTEKEEDLQAIVRLCRQIMKLKAEGGRSFRNLHVAFSSFIPKAHTPFQWLGMEKIDTIKEKLRYLKMHLTGSKFSIKWHKPEMSYLEAVMARGDRQLSGVLERAVNTGALFDGWSDHFDFKNWMDAFHDQGLHPDEYAYHTFDTRQVLPWQHLHSGLDGEFLRREMEKSEREEVTVDCSSGVCVECGISTAGKECPPRLKRATQEGRPESLTDRSVDETNRTIYKYRVKYSKGEEARFLSHLEIMRAIHRACRRAGLPLEYSKGFHPHPKISFSQALPAGVESLEEQMDLTLKSYIDPQRVGEMMNQSLPLGLRVTWVTKLSAKSTPLPQTPAKLKISVYMEADAVDFPAEEAHQQYLSDYLDKESIIIQEKKKGICKDREIRHLIERLTLERLNDNGYRLDVVINQKNEKSLNTWTFLKNLYDLNEINVRALRVVKTDAQLIETGEYAFRNRD